MIEELAFIAVCTFITPIALLFTIMLAGALTYSLSDNLTILENLFFIYVFVVIVTLLVMGTINYLEMFNYV